MNTPEHCGDDTINRLVDGEVGLARQRHEKCHYVTCQWPDCLCEHALLGGRQDAAFAEIRRELGVAREALDRLERFLKEQL